MPAPPPKGVSSTERCLSRAKPRMSTASSAQSPLSSALPASEWPSGPGTSPGRASAPWPSRARSRRGAHPAPPAWRAGALVEQPLRRVGDDAPAGEVDDRDDGAGEGQAHDGAGRATRSRAGRRRRSSAPPARGRGARRRPSPPAGRSGRRGRTRPPPAAAAPRAARRGARPRSASAASRSRDAVDLGDHAALRRPDDLERRSARSPASSVRRGRRRRPPPDPRVKLLIRTAPRTPCAPAMAPTRTRSTILHSASHAQRRSAPQTPPPLWGGAIAKRWKVGVFTPDGGKTMWRATRASPHPTLPHKGEGMPVRARPCARTSARRGGFAARRRPWRAPAPWPSAVLLALLVALGISPRPARAKNLHPLGRQGADLQPVLRALGLQGHAVRHDRPAASDCRCRSSR